MPCTTRRVFLSANTDMIRMANDEARMNDETQMTKRSRRYYARYLSILAFVGIRHSCFVIFSSCESRACSRRGREIAPSSKRASRTFPYRIERRVLLISRKLRRNLRPRTRQSFLRVKVSTPGGNPLQLLSVRDRTRPTSHPIV